MPKQFVSTETGKPVSLPNAKAINAALAAGKIKPASDKPEKPTTPAGACGPAPAPGKPLQAALAASNAVGHDEIAESERIFAERRDKLLSAVSMHHAGISQAVRKCRAKKALPLLAYAVSAFSGNRHTPNTLTDRDESACLAAVMHLKSTGGKLSDPFNPGDFFGDRSACGVRAVGHGFYQPVTASGKPANNAGDTAGFVLTDKARDTAARLAAKAAKAAS